MSLKKLSDSMLPVIEQELQQAIFQTRQPRLEDMVAMMAYHMGWEGEGAGPEARGKRIRPCWCCYAPLLPVEIGSAPCLGLWRSSWCIISRWCTTISRTRVHCGAAGRRSGCAAGLRRRSILEILFLSWHNWLC